MWISSLKCKRRHGCQHKAPLYQLRMKTICTTIRCAPIRYFTFFQMSNYDFWYPQKWQMTPKIQFVPKTRKVTAILIRLQLKSFCGSHYEIKEPTNIRTKILE